MREEWQIFLDRYAVHKELAADKYSNTYIYVERMHTDIFQEGKKNKLIFLDVSKNQAL